MAEESSGLLELPKRCGEAKVCKGSHRRSKGTYIPTGIGHEDRNTPMVSTAYQPVHGSARTQGKGKLAGKEDFGAKALAAFNASQHIAVGT